MTNSADSRKLRRSVLLAVAWIAALGSLAIGLKEGVHSGLDFQWSGARLLARGIDPWKVYLSGNLNHEIILGHQPNYLPELYVLLLPFGRIGFPPAVLIWCGMNLIFTAASLYLVARLYRLTPYNAWMLAGIMLLSIPLRVSLANGQQSLFALFFFTLGLSLAAGFRRGVSFGLAFAKYSFAPVLVFLEVLRVRWRTLTGIALPIALGILIVTRMTGSTLSVITLEPLRVPRIANSTGAGDIMTMSEFLLSRLGLSEDTVFSLSSVIGLICALSSAIFLFRKRFAPEIEIALIATLTLFCLKHLIYDYVFLVFPAALLLLWSQSPPARGRRVITGPFTAWAAIFWILVSATVRGALHVDTLAFALFSNGLCLLLVTASIVQMAKTDTAPLVSGHVIEDR